MAQIIKGELDLDSLIGPPLIAASKANEAILKHNLNYLG